MVGERGDKRERYESVSDLKAWTYEPAVCLLSREVANGFD